MPDSAGCGRFAPSPSGPLHFGSLVTALASRCDAAARGERWLVRIEDVDLPRGQPGAEAVILAQLARYGFRWDEAPLRQSGRTPRYAELVARLLAAGHAFDCACSRRELESALLAGANRRLNDCGAVLVAGSGSVLGAARFDLIVANLLSAHLLAELPGLTARLRAGGDLVYSGALTIERRELMARFRDVGLEPLGETIDGEWSAWRLRAEGGA